MQTPASSLEARESSLARREEHMQRVVEAVKALVTGLGQRVLTTIALLAGIAAFGLTIVDPSILRITAAVLYCGLVLLPLAVIDARRG